MSLPFEPEEAAVEAHFDKGVLHLNIKGGSILNDRSKSARGSFACQFRPSHFPIRLPSTRSYERRSRNKHRSGYWSRPIESRLNRAFYNT
jgi:hypothetical protein